MKIYSSSGVPLRSVRRAAQQRRDGTRDRAIRRTLTKELHTGARREGRREITAALVGG